MRPARPKTAFLATALGLAVTAACAQDRLTYHNARFGFAVTIPFAFSESDPPPENGDGRVFRTPSGDAELTVWGGHVTEDDFAAEAELRKSFTRDDGWALSYEAAGEDWAVFSGERDGRLLYERLETQCGGAQFAALALIYDAEARERIDPLIGDLADSLTSETCPGG